MLSTEFSSLYATHEVENQPQPLQEYDAFGSDAALVEGIERDGAEWALPMLTDFGRLTTSERILNLGVQANRNPPLLRTHDRFGHRVDEVEFHPAWHELMSLGVEAETHSLPWSDPRPGAHVARVAMNLMFYPVESGVGCPLTMTFAGVPVLKQEGDWGNEWVARLTSTQYDGSNMPVDQKPP